MKRELKRNITAFLLALGMLLLVSGGICLLIFIGVLLGGYLPYVVACVLGFVFIHALSIPIRDVLDDMEGAEKYDEWVTQQRLNKYIDEQKKKKK